MDRIDRANAIFDAIVIALVIAATLVALTGVRSDTYDSVYDAARQQDAIPCAIEVSNGQARIACQR